MLHKVLHGPTFSALRLDMTEGESILSQPGAMLAMTPGFAVEVKAGFHMEGARGLGRGVRSLFGGESFFTVVYRSKRDDQHLVLAPEQMGEIHGLEVGPDSEFLLARGAFLACSPDISFSLHNAGVHGVLATRGLFFLKTVGSGTVFAPEKVSSFVSQGLGDCCTKRGRGRHWAYSAVSCRLSSESGAASAGCDAGHPSSVPQAPRDTQPR